MKKKIFPAFVIISCIALVICTLIFADNKDELLEERNESISTFIEEIQEYDEQLDELILNSDKTLNESASLLQSLNETKLGLEKEKLNYVKSVKSSLTEQHSNYNKTLTELKEQNELLDENLENLVKSFDENKDNYDEVHSATREYISEIKEIKEVVDELIPGYDKQVKDYGITVDIFVTLLIDENL